MFEVWAQITDFPNYEVSNTGIVRRFDTGQQIQPFVLQDGSLGIKLSREGHQYQQLVRRLVAEAFVRPDNHFCTYVLHRDGDKMNCNRENLVWRPKWFCWKYARQFVDPIPQHWIINPVRNRVTGQEFQHIMEASYVDATLCSEIFMSCVNGRNAFPNVPYEFIEG